MLYLYFDPKHEDIKMYEEM